MALMRARIGAWQAKSYGERPTTGAGPAAEGPSVWSTNGPSTSFEGFWAASQAACAANGNEWHAAIPCKDAANEAFADTTAPGLDSEPFVSLCPETCLRPAALQCKERDNSKPLDAMPQAQAAMRVSPPVNVSALEKRQPVENEAGDAEHASAAAAGPVASGAARSETPSSELYKHTVPVGARCGHAIILAGMPRAGSTLQEKLVTRALQYLHVPLTAGPTTFWNYPKHMGMSQEEAAAIYAEEDELWQHGTTNESVLMFKSHEFDPEALRLCANTIVLTQHRDLVDQYGSAVAAFNMSEDVSLAHAVGTIKLWARNYASWKNQANGALDLRFEDVVENRDGALRTITRYLQTRLGVPEAKAPDPSMISALEGVEANPEMPSSSHGATAQTTGRVHDAIRGARDYLAGRPEDPALLGLSWGRLSPQNQSREADAVESRVRARAE